MAFCPRCNTKLPEDRHFCDFCGTRVSGSSTATARFERDFPATEPATEPVQRSGVECRFCRGLLDLNSEFCDQCGAPVVEAAPAGMVKPKPAITPPAQSTPTPADAARQKSPEVPKSVPPLGQTTVSNPRASSGVKPPLSARPRFKEVPLRVRTQASADPPGQTLTAQRQTPPMQTARQASALGPLLQKTLRREADRFPLFVAKVRPLIKSSPWIAGATGLGFVAAVVVVVAGSWSTQGFRRDYQKSATQVTSAPNLPAQAQANTPQHSQTSQSTAPRSTPTPSEDEAKAQAAEISRLENLARDAYTKAIYAVPVETSAIAYTKRVLEIDASNNYSRTLLENSVAGGKYQVQQALKHKSFARAHRLANAMAQLLPGRKDIAELQQDIRIAERGTTAPRRQEAVGKVSFIVYHMHSEKAPADHGPYCLGVLSVVGQRLKFSAHSASRGQKAHKLDFACSDVREIKKNTRVASRQGGFHVRTVSGNMNFAPRDSSLAHISALASVCTN